ncbi:copper uptake system-associated protein [Oharaeibacter diazotrophicus]|uniref:Copper uptake system-associated protein n=1 Tax=Oharaeibacter diazotrophicus TaxID=1920512 RepID=A0A4R6RIH8_9HYPH|nr:copper uptake system-associated protein [Oharaeibacter diazotrophicus]TDP85456.1 hypothetical protein EDD54_2309 [Oharaeibacter diazotrophicus]BBE74426.1 hypothetical protein OHA_1_04057 [Pleomorphomonas sp. SM30]GLS75878.1 hypothetical protein GCM10007904_12130 [Oharaeibacter diazotrophicus]
MIHRIRHAAVAAVALVALAVAAAQPATAHDDVGAVTHLMMATFDKPETPLAVSPVVVEGDFAVAGWTQDGRGGRALLKRKGHDWALHLCAGDALKDATALRQMGIPAADADALAADLAAAEAKEDPARVALFATFEGVVEMNADGGHPDHAGHDAHAGHTDHAN